MKKDACTSVDSAGGILAKFVKALGELRSRLMASANAIATKLSALEEAEDNTKNALAVCDSELSDLIPIGGLDAGGSTWATKDFWSSRVELRIRGSRALKRGVSGRDA